jgi:hypothetical protein
MSNEWQKFLIFSSNTDDYSERLVKKCKDFIECSDVKNRERRHSRVSMIVEGVIFRLQSEKQCKTFLKNSSTQTYSADVGNASMSLYYTPVDNDTHMGNRNKSDPRHYLEKFWEIDLLSAQNHLSDPFEYMGGNVRASFGVNSDGGGYHFFICCQNILPIEVNQVINVEFRLDCILKPTITRLTSIEINNLAPIWQGIKAFIGNEVLSYLDDGILTLSIRLSRHI